MIQRKLAHWFLLLVLCIAAPYQNVFAQTVVPAGQAAVRKPVDQRFLADLAQRLDVKLKDKSVGYEFFIVSKGTTGVGGSGGAARRAPDPDPRSMSFDDRINIASVSKTITAAAVLKLMREKKIAPDTPVARYLPADWVIGPHFDLVTFADLLTHRAGIRCAVNATYVNVKLCVAGGVKLPDMQVQKYNNLNFALFRMIIPILHDTKNKSITDEKTAPAIFGNLYIDYVRKTIFGPAGLKGIECKPAVTDPALCYQYPGPVMEGESFGDMSDTNAARGWNLSAKQLASLLFDLLETHRVISAKVAAQMTRDHFGLWMDDKTIPGITSYDHSGYYPGKDKDGKPFNNGEMNSYIVHFSNGIDLAVIVNSQFGPGQSIAKAVKDAMKETLQ
jgi:CubicO group peptidase (beta-lactamase class C family)